MLGYKVGVLTELITGAFDLNDDGVVKQPIEESGGDNGIAEDLAPFCEAAVRGEDHGSLFVSCIDELEEQIAAAWGARLDAARVWPFRPFTALERRIGVAMLASRPGVVKSRNALMDAAYDDEEYVDDRTIDSHIKRLRIKFKANDVEFDMVETLYGIGYRFKDV